MISIAIDGPSGAGKSSLAKALAKDLGYVYVDTGAMYRSIGLYAVRAGVDPHDADAVAALLPQVKLGIRLIDGAQHIYLNGEDVSTAIRAEEIGMAASAVAAHPAVRSFLLDTQRGLAESQNILMDGRSSNAQLIRRENGKNYKVNTHYSSFNVEIVDSQAKYLRMRKKGEEEQNDCITSPMPGKVVKIPVTVGQEMKAGDTAIVIEAMKMQSNYKVSSDCRIKEILVQEGDNITGEQTLITLEPIA